MIISISNEHFQYFNEKSCGLIKLTNVVYIGIKVEEFYFFLLNESLRFPLLRIFFYLVYNWIDVIRDF